MGLAATIADSLLAVAFPRDCRCCGNQVERQADGVACGACWNGYRFFTGRETACAKCGLFLGESESLFETFCRKCDDHAYEIARSAGPYRGPAAAEVINLKTNPFLSSRFQNAACTAFADSFRDGADILVPVPLSRKRFIERGYNQAAFIAEFLGRSSGIAVDETSLQRVVDTPHHRAGMDRKARDLSVRNAFKVVRPKLIAGKSVILIDDVLTSGSTASYCAKALMKSGAARVDVFTLARAA